MIDLGLASAGVKSAEIFVVVILLRSPRLFIVESLFACPKSLFAIRFINDGLVGWGYTADRQFGGSILDAAFVQFASVADGALTAQVESRRIDAVGSHGKLYR